MNQHLNPRSPTLAKDWPAFGVALLIGLFECGALLRSRAARAWRRFTRP